MSTANSPAQTAGPAGPTPAGQRFNINGLVALLVAFFLVGVVVVQWQRSRLMNRLIESAGIQAAQDHLTALATVRTVYTDEVVKVATRNGIDVTHDYRKDDHSI